MDIADRPQSEFHGWIEDLFHGRSICYNGVTFRLDGTKTPPEIVVVSFSDYLRSENVHEREAKEKIKRSKGVAEDLADRSDAFRSVWQEAVKQFGFCYDYGAGGVLVAEESAGKFVWHKGSNAQNGTRYLSLARRVQDSVLKALDSQHLGK
jgi:hypothetical protein